MKSSLPLQLQTAIKISLAMPIAWVISSFFGFPISFLAPLFAGVATLAGLSISYFLLTRGTVMIAISFSFGVLFSIFWGNNYIAIFCLVLVMGFFWNYFKLHGFIGSFLALMIKMGFIVIHSNSSDHVTTAFYEFSNYFIGISVATIFNRLFWVNTTQELLTNHLQTFSDDISQLIELIFTGYLQGNLNQSLVENLQTKINKTLQSSEKILKMSSFEPTNKLATQAQWQKIINTEKNIYFHLSAILRLVESNQKIDLPPIINDQLMELSASFQSTLPLVFNGILENEKVDVANLNQELFILQTLLKNNRNNGILKQQKLSVIMNFYSIINRLEKLINEINKWGNNHSIYQQNLTAQV